MGEEKKAKDGKFDVFVAESIFPEAGQVFSARYEGIDDVKGDCLITLDTNALLVPYAIGKESLQQIGETYAGLIAENRLIIPGQVAREFAKNRANKLAELFQQFNRKLNVSNLQKGRYPLLESLEAYQEAIEIEDEIDALLAKYKKAIQRVMSDIRNWTWNDPVSLLYADRFGQGVIQDLRVDKAKIIEELERRQLHNIPPGYKDSAKDDEGIGDFLIWLSILRAGRIHRKSMLFVSGEEKPDWFHRSEKQALYPRFELVDEYRRFSQGKTFHIVSFSRFLDIFGASETTVQEVREEERRFSIESSIVGEFLIKWRELEVALFEQYGKIYPDKMQSRPPSIPHMVQVLLQHEMLSQRFYHLASEMRDLRNRVVHGSGNIPIEIIREAIPLINELLKDIGEVGGNLGVVGA